MDACASDICSSGDNNALIAHFYSPSNSFFKVVDLQISMCGFMLLLIKLQILYLTTSQYMRNLLLQLQLVSYLAPQWPGAAVSTLSQGMKKPMTFLAGYPLFETLKGSDHRHTPGIPTGLWRPRSNSLVGVHPDPWFNISLGSNKN